MKSLGPNGFLWIWTLVNFALLGLGVVTLIKFLIVLFKADKAIDEVREYVRRRN